MSSVESCCWPGIRIFLVSFSSQLRKGSVRSDRRLPCTTLNPPTTFSHSVTTVTVLVWMRLKALYASHSISWKFVKLMKPVGADPHFTFPSMWIVSDLFLQHSSLLPFYPLVFSSLWRIVCSGGTSSSSLNMPRIANTIFGIVVKKKSLEIRQASWSVFDISNLHRVLSQSWFHYPCPPSPKLLLNRKKQEKSRY